MLVEFFSRIVRLPHCWNEPRGEPRNEENKGVVQIIEILKRFLSVKTIAYMCYSIVLQKCYSLGEETATYQLKRVLLCRMEGKHTQCTDVQVGAEGALAQHSDSIRTPLAQRSHSIRTALTQH